MSIKAEYWNGVFKPLERVGDSDPGKIYQVFSEDELRQLAEDLPWLKGSERSFEFWENKEDAVFDQLSTGGHHSGLLPPTSLHPKDAPH